MKPKPHHRLLTVACDLIFLVASKQFFRYPQVVLRPILRDFESSMVKSIGFSTRDVFLAPRRNGRTFMWALILLEKMDSVLGSNQNKSRFPIVLSTLIQNLVGLNIKVDGFQKSRRFLKNPSNGSGFPARAVQHPASGIFLTYRLQILMPLSTALTHCGEGQMSLLKPGVI